MPLKIFHFVKFQILGINIQLTQRVTFLVMIIKDFFNDYNSLEIINNNEEDIVKINSMYFTIK